MTSQPKATPIHIEEINGKPFGFQVQEYKGKMYLVGREMYHDASTQELVFGRNGVNIQLDGACAYLQQMITVLAEATGLTAEEVINQIGF